MRTTNKKELRRLINEVLQTMNGTLRNLSWHLDNAARLAPVVSLNRADFIELASQAYDKIVGDDEGEW
jgi:hypothetical protein